MVTQKSINSLPNSKIFAVNRALRCRKRFASHFDVLFHLKILLNQKIKPKCCFIASRQFSMLGEVFSICPHYQWTISTQSIIQHVATLEWIGFRQERFSAIVLWLSYYLHIYTIYTCNVWVQSCGYDDI